MYIILHKFVECIKNKKNINFIKNFIIFGQATKDSSPDFTDLNQKRKKDEKK